MTEHKSRLKILCLNDGLLPKAASTAKLEAYDAVQLAAHSLAEYQASTSVAEEIKAKNFKGPVIMNVWPLLDLHFRYDENAIDLQRRETGNGMTGEDAAHNNAQLATAEQRLIDHVDIVLLHADRASNASAETLVHTAQYLRDSKYKGKILVVDSRIDAPEWRQKYEEAQRSGTIDSVVSATPVLGRDDMPHSRERIR